ncbi:MAG: mannosyltransferase family protein, partial [Clostridia bacterium]|nr:mannosyltransferase family protein [Clostridia bacterium]
MSGARLFQLAVAGISVALMGLCGVRLLASLTRVLLGKETEGGLSKAACAQGRGAPPSALIAAALCALLSRLLLYALAYAMHRAMGRGGSPLETFELLWNHWDTPHYIGIAAEGYTSVGNERLRLVFFPLYPLLMRLVSPLTGGDLFLSGVAVSLACACISAALLYALAYMHGGRETAALSVAYFLLDPMSVFLGCCYTESLFIALTLGAILLLRRGRPWLAALCGAASALTRMPGVIVAGLPIIALLGKFGRRQARPRGAAACAGQVAVVFSGLAVYWLINWRVTGDPLMYMTYQRENWFQEPGTFWGSAMNTAYYALETFGEDGWFFSWGYQLIAMLAVFALLAFRANRLPFDLAAYSFVYVAVVLAPTWLLSGPRYLYALAPLPLLRACMTR